jgi:CRP-like cAMP-binding protein
MVDVPEDNEALRGFLKTTSLFGALDAAVADRVIAMLKPHRYEPGETVFAEGDKGHSLYLVREGQCIVGRHCQHGGPSARLMAMRPGDHFGVTAVIEMEPRPFSCVAEKDSLLYEMTNADLYALYKCDLKAYIIVLQNISRELCRRLRKAAVRIANLEDSLRVEHEQHK